MKGQRVSPIAVIVAAAGHFVLGAVWFTVFSRPWLEGMGKTRAALAPAEASPALAYLAAFVSNLIIATVLAWLIITTGRATMKRGALLGGLVWLGFVGTTMGTALVFEQRSLKAFAITAGYPLVGLLMMGAIIGGWARARLARPRLGEAA